MISAESESLDLETVWMMNRECLRIKDCDDLPPFFISVVSDQDHWMFLSSHGGVTAGRGNADHALFPYYTEDKIRDGAGQTGSRTLIVGEEGSGQAWDWEVFSAESRGRFALRRNLYKSLWGDMIVFEEINETLELTYRYAWMSSARYGFVKRSELIHTGRGIRMLRVMDGLRNILPSGVTAQTQNEFSCLIDAYKDNRFISGYNLAVYRMSSLLTDKAEPSEALRASVVWTPDKNLDAVLLSEYQVDEFRARGTVHREEALRGRRGAFYALRTIHLEDGNPVTWYTVADVDQSQAQVIDLLEGLRSSEVLEKSIEDDIRRGTENLQSYVGLADGLQSSNAQRVSVHHYANVLFNIMRGGIFPRGYIVEIDDFLSFAACRNRSVLKSLARIQNDLGPTVNLKNLRTWAEKTGSPDILRLVDEYLPLAFSRRHGDPSRPWNKFDISLRDQEGRPKLNYQGNWRDIFQNWEALLLSFPEYVPQVVAKFLNAMTADGYNPYRVTRDGIEWEVPEPENPWSNIGYWGDHQIVYLQRLLELWEKFQPGAVATMADQDHYAFADVPYRIRSYREILQDPRDTIEFDTQKNAGIEEELPVFGSDARLIRDPNGAVVHVNLVEKLLVAILAKTANFVPGGGIWMNTQRPEWNDANNALVGPGLSVVTLCYLRRMAGFLINLFQDRGETPYRVNGALAELFQALNTSLSSGKPEDFNDSKRRRQLMDRLGESATHYRDQVYSGDLFAEKTMISSSRISDFLGLLIRHFDATLARCRRDDGLYDSYNLLALSEGEARIRKLQVMLEGQVAVLSSGYLDSGESLELLERLESSPLYRKDQDSYMLYPDKELPDFLSLNRVDPADVEAIPLLSKMANAGDRSLVEKDARGTYRFNANFRNAGDLAEKLDHLASLDSWSRDVEDSRRQVLDLYEKVFDHGSFTGRSGTFYAYEGLGSIYWHMVSKLLLATQEKAFAAMECHNPAEEGLVRRYFRVRSGLSFNKTPEVYGAFVTDPYSHSPGGAGAKQPGMTGQVKEEILTRWGELGVEIHQGRLGFHPRILPDEEYLNNPKDFTFVNAEGEWREHSLDAGTLAFTYCGVPIQYDSRSSVKMAVTYSDGKTRISSETRLSAEDSRSIFRRDGRITGIVVGTRGT